jgi:hypothetical protein
MTKSKNEVETQKPDHTTFSGRIYDYDFDGKMLMSNMVARIMSDWHFDEECRRNEIARDSRKKTVTSEDN